MTKIVNLKGLVKLSTLIDYKKNARKRIINPVEADSKTVSTMVRNLQTAFPFLHRAPIGQTVLGRNIEGIILGDGKNPILYTAATHGQEWITSLVLLRLIEDICTAIEKNSSLADIKIRQALANSCLVFVPQLNPDGVDIAIHGSGSAGVYGRSVRELGGNNHGVWQANARGVDLNHNFNAGWKILRDLELNEGIHGPAPRRYCGPAPESEPETQALVELCGRSQFSHVVALHSQGEEIYWHYGENTPIKGKLMAEIMGAVSDYKVTVPEKMAAHGGFKDWFIETTGNPGFTIELGKGENPLPLSEFEKIYDKSLEMLLFSAFF